MKVLSFLALLVSGVAQCQESIISTWQTSTLFGGDDSTEYVLLPVEPGYQCSLHLNADGTFWSSSGENCGFPEPGINSASGTFELVDDSHIRVTRTFPYSDGHKHAADLGLYYIARDPASIKLIKSDGNLQKDKDNQRYSAMIDAYKKDLAENADDFITDSNISASDNIADIVKAVLRKQLVNIYERKICYVKMHDSKYGHLILVEHANKFYYIKYAKVSGRTTLFVRKT